jgi:hypothetical protein
MSGWIKLHRQILDNPIWSAEKFTRGQAWVDLILLANHDDNYIYLRDHKIMVKRGQVGWSENTLSARWKWSRTKTKNFLKMLELEQQVSVQKSHSMSIITLINYNGFQGKEQLESNRKATEKQQKSTNKNVKNEKNDKKRVLFDTFWEQYERRGSRQKAYEQFDLLSDDDISLIELHMPEYMKEYEPKYRKHFERYLRDGLIEGTKIKDKPVENL